MRFGQGNIKTSLVVVEGSLPANETNTTWVWMRLSESGHFMVNQFSIQ